jgi:hypothetical protein
MEQRFESSGKETTKIGRRYGDAIGGFAGSVVCPSSSFSALEGDFSFNGAAEPDSFDSLSLLEAAISSLQMPSLRSDERSPMHATGSCSGSICARGVPLTPRHFARRGEGVEPGMASLVKCSL